MKILICGSDNFNNVEFIKSNLTNIISKEQCSKENPIGSWNMEIVYGSNPKPFDHIVEKWAKQNVLSLKPFPAEWNNENPRRPEGWDSQKPIVLSKPNFYGTYNALAGYLRNQEMVNYAYNNGGGLCIVFDAEEGNKKTGNKDVITRAKKSWLKVYHVKCHDLENVKIKIYNEGLQK